MVERYKNKYRVPSARLTGYDYGQPGWYFITICTKFRICHFGDVINKQMMLSRAGEIISEEWQKTEILRDDVILDAWCVMPNHFHAIVVIQPPNDNVETHRMHLGSTPQQYNNERSYQNKFGPQRRNVSSIIRGFKGAVTKRIRDETHIPDFDWQERFHDHIIRNERALYNIRKYIYENPAKWHDDTFFVS